MKKYGVLLFCTIFAFAAGISDISIPVYADYSESTETIQNPGAGYTSTLWISCKPENTPVCNPTGSIVLMFVDIGGFSSGANGTSDENGNYTDGTDIPLDDVFFANMRKTLENARKNGCMVALRFRYDANGRDNPEPATFDFLLSHIKQIENDGFLEDYKDIIAFVESGFTGKWGEQHGGKYTSYDYNAKVLAALLECVPAPIPVTVRTPGTAAAYFGIEKNQLADYTPEPDSNASRVGMYDDGYMGSDSDLGTYSNRENETAWLGRQTLTSYFGGEFSGNIEFAKKYDTYLPENAVPEMYKTHLSYINSNIFQLYKDYTFSEQYSIDGVDNSAYYGQTVYKFIRDHIGYRFVLRSCDFDSEVNQGGVLNLSFNVENTGFANPIMQQKTELILENNGRYIIAETDTDTRKWYSAQTSENNISMKIPGGLETGEWNIYLKISVGNNDISEMNFRSVEFANDSVWNEQLGANYLGTFTVSENNDAESLTDERFFQTNAENQTDKSDGRVYNVNDVISLSTDNLVKETDDKKLYISADEEYLYVSAVIPQNAAAPVYNIQIKPENDSKTYWYYKTSGNAIYFNNGSYDRLITDVNGDIVRFRIPLGETMNINPGTVLSSVRVSIQDSADSWKNVGEIVSDAYTIPDGFTVYSSKQTVFMNKGDKKELSVLTSSDCTGYQWFFNGNEIKGADSQTYTLTASETGIYSVRVTSANGVSKTADICEISGIFSDTDIRDITVLKRWLLEGTAPEDYEIPDMNNDGKIDICDLCIMKEKIIK
ncbi:MAG TPA: hypothetical protein DIW26_05945 [Ruminococcus sp.]|nr:hypothetical protein [Ruminococcus sp.]